MEDLGVGRRYVMIHRQLPYGQQTVEFRGLVPMPFIGPQIHVRNVATGADIYTTTARHGFYLEGDADIPELGIAAPVAAPGGGGWAALAHIPMFHPVAAGGGAVAGGGGVAAGSVAAGAVAEGPVSSARNGKDKECQICFEHLDEDIVACETTKEPAAGTAADPVTCGHKFHRICINEWHAGKSPAYKKCPSCNVIVYRLRTANPESPEAEGGGGDEMGGTVGGAKRPRPSRTRRNRKRRNTRSRRRRNTRNRRNNNGNQHGI